MLILSTSPRANSNSLRVALYLQKIYVQAGIESQVITFEKYDLPTAGRSALDKNNLTDFQASLVVAWEKAQMVTFVLPEYNWSTNAETINLLHQIGGKDFAYLLHNKIFSLVGVSTGRGGRVPCLDITTILNKVISFTNKYSFISPRLLESHETDKNLDEQGNSLGNAMYEKTAEAFVKYTLNIAQKWNFEEVLVS